MPNYELPLKNLDGTVDNSLGVLQAGQSKAEE